MCVCVCWCPHGLDYFFYFFRCLLFSVCSNKIVCSHIHKYNATHDIFMFSSFTLDTHKHTIQNMKKKSFFCSNLMNCMRSCRRSTMFSMLMGILLLFLHRFFPYAGLICCFVIFYRERLFKNMLFCLQFDVR